MKSKGIATIVLASAAFLVSCQKDDLNISPQPFPSRIEKISMDNDLMTLNYDAGGRVSTVSLPDQIQGGATPVEFTISYDAASRITKLSNGTDYTITPVYENNELSRVQATNASNETIYVTDYEYLNGFLKSAVVKVDDGSGGLTNGLKFIYLYDANGNVSKTQMYIGHFGGSDWLYVGSQEFTYDNKVNPLKNIKSLLQILLLNISGNNILTDKSLDVTGQVEQTQTFTYTYNSQNLPVSATVQILETGSAPVSKQVRYTYKP